MTKELPTVPDELKVLIPEIHMKVVVIGKKAYEMYPMKEGVVEAMSKEVMEIFTKASTYDGKCVKCGKVVKDAAKREIYDCPACKIPLTDLKINPIEAVLSTGKVPEWVERILDIVKDEVKEMTLPQMKHFAAILWQQNFSDEGLPVESAENFQKLLVSMGMVSLKKVPTAKTAPTMTAKE